MLQSIREHLHGWIAGIILALIAASFLLFGVQYYLQSSASNGTAVAEVNGEKITAQQWDIAYQNLRDQTQANSATPLTLSMQAHLRKVALQHLITRAAMDTATKKQNWVATPTQIQEVLNTIPAFQVNGQFSEERYEQVLAINGLTPQQFEQQLHSDVVSEQIRAGLAQTAFVLPNEVTAGYSLLRQTRDFSYVIIPASKFIKSVQVSEADIHNYYTQNQKLWITPEQVSVNYIVIDPAAIAVKTVISEAEMQQYYQDHADRFHAPHRWQVKQLFVPAGKDANAKVLSMVQALESGKAMDVVGKAETRWIDAGKTTDPKIVSVLSQMQPQQISIPVTTNEGTAIFQLLKSTPGAVLPFADVRSDIHQALQNEKVQKILMKQSNLLEKVTYTHPDNLAYAAKALNVPLQTSPTFTHKGTGKGLFSNPMVIQAAFSSTVLQGNNSEVLTLSDGTIVVLHVLKYQPKQTEPLAQVQDKIQTLLTTQAARKEAAKAAHALMLNMLNDGNPATLAKQNGYQWKQVKNQTRNTIGIDSAILTAVFHTTMDSSHTRLADIALSNGDYAVIQLDAVHLPDAAGLSPVMQQALSGQIKELNSSAEYQLYVRSMKRNAKIKKTA